MGDVGRTARYCRCGARLAHDNADALCALCQRKAEDAARHPPTVPAAFWEVERMRDALACQHMGRVLQAYRSHPFHGARGVSQERVAGWLGISQAQLSRIENGPPLRDLERLVQWAQILGIPGSLLWFGPALDGQDERGPLTVSPSDVIGGTSLDGLALQAQTLAPHMCAVPVLTSDGTVVLIAMDRRRLLSGVAAAGFVPIETAVNNATGSPAHLLMPQGRKRFRPPPEDLTAVTRFYRRLDRHLPSWKLIEAASAHYQFLDGLYADGDGDGVGMAAAVSEAAGLAAWLSMDMGQPAQAQRHYRNAITAAHQASNPTLAAYMLGSLSWLAAQLGDGAKALKLIQSARGSIEPAAENPTISAWLAVHEALAHATLSKEDRALAFLEHGAEAVQRSVQESVVWPWLYPFSQSKLAGFSGACFVRLRRTGDARSALSRALASSADGTRERAEILVDLAQAFTLQPQQDIDRSCALLADAAAISADKGSGRLWQRVHSVRAGLDRYSAGRSVRRLDEQLRAISQ